MKRQTYLALASLFIFGLIIIFWPKWELKNKSNNLEEKIYMQELTPVVTPESKTDEINKEEIFVRDVSTGTPISTGSGNLLMPRDLQ